MIYIGNVLKILFSTIVLYLDTVLNTLMSRRPPPPGSVICDMRALLFLASVPAVNALGLVVQRTVDITAAASTPWHDVTAEVAAVLPNLACALATVCAPTGSRLAVLDPAMLEVGPAEIVAPSDRWSEAISLGVRDGVPLLPSDVRIILLSASGQSDAMTSLDVSIEAAEPLLTASRGPASGAEAMAQAALRTALAAGGVKAAAVAALEEAAEPTPAGRVYESFVRGKPLRPEALLAAARRAAHHISHLLREEAAAAAEYLRNNDAAIDAARRHLPAHRVHLVLDNVRTVIRPAQPILNGYI